MKGEASSRLGELLGVPRIYDAKVRLRQDDLLVRERAGQSLGKASTAVRDLAIRFARERIPSPTREEPLPPSSQMATLHRLEEVLRQIRETETRLRSSSFPAQDAIWDRWRDPFLQLELLTQVDVGLVSGADRVVGEALALTLASVEESGSLEGITRSIEAFSLSIDERERILLFPAR